MGCLGRFQIRLNVLHEGKSQIQVFLIDPFALNPSTAAITSDLLFFHPLCNTDADQECVLAGVNL